MAGKKKIQKNQKNSKVKKDDEEEVKVPEVEKSPQSDVEPPQAENIEDKKEKQDPSLNLFTESFYQKLGRFKNFYKELLTIKNGDDKEFDEISKRVMKNLEEVCSTVLKQDIKDAEKWMNEQQQEVQDQIIATNQALESTKNALTETKSFTDSELLSQVAPIEQKKEKLEKTLEEYQLLKDRARKIYTNDGIDEE